MNKVDAPSRGSFLEYQASRLQALINEMVKCCEDRKIYENQKFGLPYAEIKCLLLFQGERYLTVKSIASRLDVAKSRVTKLVNGLLAKGYVERIDDPKDTRVKLISLTQSGRRKIAEVEAFHLSLHQKLIQCIDPEDRGELLSYLEQLRNGMEEVKQEFA